MTVHLHACRPGHGMTVCAVHQALTQAAPCSGDNRGPACRPCVGSAGLGVWGCRPPMSTVVQHVPVAIGVAARSSAQGIVTRMGRDPKGLGCAAIEPGPEGMRPASFAAGNCDAGALGDAAAAAVTCSFSAGAAAAAARLHTPPSNTGVNKVQGAGRYE